jgi:hypothetical protein
MIFSPFAYRQETVSAGPPYKPSVVIPTSGLTLYLDAGATDSYPESGTTWYDLSGNANHGTLTNGATYNSANGGSIQFDGVNDYISFASVNNMPTGNTNYTIICFMKKDTTPRRDGMIGYGTLSGRRYLGFRTKGSPAEGDGVVTYWYAADFQTFDTLSTNTWYSMVSNWDNSAFQREMFINDTSIGTNTPSGNHNVDVQSNMVVGATDVTGTVPDDYMDGNISVMIVYNRVLNNTDLTSIWNSFKGRYGY